MALLYFKALHIVGAVAWFSGLFYLVRILVYLREAQAKSEQEQKILVPQFSLMANRVYKIICNPAMMITWTFGIAMLIVNPIYFQLGWFHFKLLLVILLTVYHLYCKKWMKALIAGHDPFTSFQLRLLNEVPTLLLVGIVFLAVIRNGLNVLYLFGGIVLFGLLLYAITKAYKRSREQNET